MKPKELPHELPDAETCNPKICKWCKYSTNGKRNAGRSITMCDGCRYNEEFEHIQVFDADSTDNESKAELLEGILHEFVFLDGLYCTDREDIVEKIKTMEEDVIWQIDEQELIKDIANYLEDTEKGTTFEERIYNDTIGNEKEEPRILITVDKEKLKEQLMSIVGTCQICDLHNQYCNKNPCGYGLSDELIEEKIKNCTVEE